MALYSARVKTRNGVKAVEIDAKDDPDARRQAIRFGQILVIKKQRQFSFNRGLTQAERNTFLQRLSAMLASRVGAGEALTLIRDTFTGRIRWVAGTLLRKVENGADLAEGMEAIGGRDFPEATVALIKAGSRGGETWRSLQDASIFEAEMAKIKQSSSKGMWGAIGAFFIAGAVVLASTMYIGPKVKESSIISDNADAATTAFMDNFAAGMTYTMGAIMVLFLMLLWLGTMGRKIMPKQADNLILKIPFYKDLVLSKNNYTVLYGLARLIKSGVRIEEALRLAQETSPPGALREDLRRAMEAVRSGKPWASVMTTLHPTDKAALATAQDREQVAKSLDALAYQYRELYGQRLAAFTPIMQMTAALFLALGGGVLFGMSILPMLQATSGILQ